MCDAVSLATFDPLCGMIANSLWKQCAVQVCFPSLASASKQDNARVKCAMSVVLHFVSFTKYYLVM